jgi:hypothetical protein
MRCRIVLLMALLAAVPSLAQGASPSATDEDGLVASTQKAVERALDYRQGDRASLMDAKADFMAGGWSEFMKRMDGWLDDKGAPLGSETFTPSGNAVVKSRGNDVIRLTIPGTLEQRQNQSRTTYQITVDVQLGGNRIRIEHLETITGGGAAGHDSAADAAETDTYRGIAHRIFERIAALKDRYPRFAATAAADRLTGAACFDDGA